ncbi:MAG: hypothetical protein ACYSWU_02495 [Planctomycetota bacterium]|jgi:hypothetical protein
MSQEEQEKHAQDLTAGDAGRSSTPEEDLPPSLKAIEAELASLSPRTDRLDRERLIFLAGQQSVWRDTKGTKGTVPFSLRENRDSPLRENRDSPRVRWGWPAAFTAMSAVAAALLVMLLSQPETPGGRPVVEVPVDRSSDGGVGPDADLPTSPQDGRQVKPPTSPPEPSPEPGRRSRLLASVGFDWLRLSDRGRLGPEASYPRLLDHVLKEGIDDWPLPAPAVGAGRATAPVPYRELYDSILGSPTSEKPGPDRPLMHTLFYPGANS